VASGFLDIQFAHSGAQGTSVETKDLGGTIFPADFPLGMFKNLDDIFTLDVLECNAVLGLFSEQVPLARRRYRAFLKRGIAQGQRPDLVGGGLIRSIGGSTTACDIPVRLFFVDLTI
jgi:hypothetical protein